MPNAPDLASEGGIGEHHAQYIGKIPDAMRVYCLKAMPAVLHFDLSNRDAPLFSRLNKEDQVFTRTAGKL